MIQLLRYEDRTLQLCVPDIAEVRVKYTLLLEQGYQIAFPHWAKLWPSALAMADFLETHKADIAGKTVLELAAGLGLPSLVVAQYAKQVCCSDYLPEAVAVIEESVRLNGLQNVSCRLLDWFDLPDTLAADVVLLSDINYEPAAFDQLYAVIRRFLLAGSTVILSTPQRLMARPFIERLLLWCIHQEEVIVPDIQQPTYISILVLKM